jgi:glycogen(starch) synthase
MIERLLIDTQLRDRLVAEASEHVLRFDWDDIAQRTQAIYSDLVTITVGAEEQEQQEEEVRRT